MTRSARNDSAHAREQRQRIRACSIKLSSGSSLLSNLQWSEIGQGLVVTDDAIVVLSPLTGLHPTLVGQSRAQDVECHPDWDGCFPHAVIHVNIKTFLANEPSHRRRLLIESDHSSTDARFLNPQWCSATWSKPGLGPHGSCLILATTSELDLFILGAPRNAWTGEWILLHAVQADPIAHLTELDLAASVEDDLRDDSDRVVFSRSRTLLRKKQMATEVLCASYAYIERPDPSQNTTATQGTTTYVVAGTRSGHIAVWKCYALTGRCDFISATAVSRTGIQQLTLTTNTAALEANAQARIAFQDADGIRLCDLFSEEPGISIRLSTLAPVCSHHSMVSTWRWIDHQLFVCTIGKIIVYNVRDGRTAILRLATEPSTSVDLFSPPISIDACSGSEHSLKVVLQDLREYLISTTQADQSRSLPDTLYPSYPPPLLGYPPMIESLQRKHDVHQAFLGYKPDPGSILPSGALIGAVCTDERVAFLGYNVTETVRYQMEVCCSANLQPKAVLNEAFERLAAATSIPPYLIARSILALLYTSQQPDAFRDQLLSAAEMRWRALLDSTNGESDSISEQAKTAQRRLLYLLVCRLEVSSPHEPSTVDTLMKLHKASVLGEWLGRWLPDLLQITTEGTTEQDRQLLLRLSIAARMLPTPPTALLETCTAAFAALNSPQYDSELNKGVPIPTDENCAACEAQLTLSWNEQQQGFGWAKCQAGHVWPRCSVTLATISDREARVCSACWSKSLLPGTAGQGSWQSLMLEAASRCIYCGSCWILR